MRPWLETRPCVISHLTDGGDRGYKGIWSVSDISESVPLGVVRRVLFGVAGRGPVLALAVMLVVVPPGGAVCWPLPNGWHLHISWTDAAGRASPSLVVFSHRGAEPIVDPHRSGISPLVAPDVVNASDLRPLGAGALWLMLLLPLVWLCLPDFTLLRQPQPSPLKHPPTLPMAA